jgi:hypothetical protein
MDVSNYIHKSLYLCSSYRGSISHSLFFNQNKTRMKNAILSLFFLLSAFAGFGQITTSAISGVVKNDKNDQLVGATIHATHLPTGTVYTATTNKSGVYVLPAVRVGGPYTIHASFVGFRKGEAVDVNTQLGITSNVDFVLIDEVVALKEVVVTNRNNTFSKQVHLNNLVVVN